ncbi:MAG: SDR family oxidoreductase [Bacteroidota bacterium]|nr:SDR family oxidoreductase [Bacteroidota bacterium]MDE2957607.1 SDR family oxidoreductase [Bacteroidota bacterium]
MSFDLRGRVALITGSSAGLGKAMAFALARAGAKVVINYANSEERAYRTYEELRATGAAGMLVRADVTTESGVRSMVSQVREELGPVDILIPNATAVQPQRRIEDYSWSDYQAMLDFFVKSPFLLVKECLPDMKRRRWGRIINIITEVFSLGVAPFTAYAAAKGGQVGLSRSLATELASFGITVNMISPGWIPVERHARDPQNAKDRYLKSVPVGRWGVPEDVAGAVVYYASDEASFVTGQCVTVSGGRSFAL